MTTGYDRLSLIELDRQLTHKEADLVYREEFHNRPDEDYEQWLIEVETQDRENEQAYQEYIKEENEYQERLNRSIQASRLIINSLLKWLRE